LRIFIQNSGFFKDLNDLESFGWIWADLSGFKGIWEVVGGLYLGDLGGVLPRWVDCILIPMDLGGFTRVIKVEEAIQNASKFYLIEATVSRGGGGRGGISRLKAKRKT
jgi:hypothetical protein